MPTKFQRNFACWKCGGNIREALEQEKKLCDEVKTVMKFMYLGDRMSAGGGCEAAVDGLCLGSAVSLLYGMRFPLKKRTVYKSYIWPTNLYVSKE